MTSSQKQMIRRLSVPEKVLLVEELWDSISRSAGSVPVSEEQWGILAERVEAWRKDPSRTISHAERVARLRNHLPDLSA